MALEVLAIDCGTGACPTVFRADNGWLVVQGLEIDDADHLSIGVPDGEQRVKIREKLLLDAAEELLDAGVRGRHGRSRAKEIDHHEIV